MLCPPRDRAEIKQEVSHSIMHLTREEPGSSFYLQPRKEEGRKIEEVGKEWDREEGAAEAGKDGNAE